MPVIITAVLASLSLIMTVLGTWRHSRRLSWLGGLFFAAYLIGMLVLSQPWEYMLLSALVLLSISGWRFGRGTP